MKIISTDIDLDDELIDVENSSDEFVPIQEKSQMSSDEAQSEIMDTNSYVDTDPSDVFTNCPNLKERCLQEVKQSDLLDVIIDKLHCTSQLHDFMCLLQDLKCGRLPCDNIVFLLLLECVKSQNCRNTVGMRYGDKTKLFWTIVYRLCKGSGLKFFSGSKNWGQVVNKETDRSIYDPDVSKINFAVPDEKVLCEYRQELPKLIPPGKIHASLELLYNKNDIILIGDGKLVTKGLKTDFAGDVNLFRHETSPNLDDLKEEYRNLLEYISACCRNFKCSNIQDQCSILGDLLEITTKLCQRIHNCHTSQKKKITNFMSRQDKQLDKVISSCKTNMYTSAIWIKKTLSCKTNMYTSAIWIKKILKCNMQLMHTSSTLLCNLHLFSTAERLSMNELQNVRILYGTDYICQNVDFLEYPHLVKHHSEIWYDLLQESVITTDTAYAAIGLDSVLSMKNCFKHYIKQEITANSDQSTTVSSMELTALATICSTFMPALLPSCAVLYEEGCSFIHGKNRKNLLCSTNTAIIRYII